MPLVSTAYRLQDGKVVRLSAIINVNYQRSHNGSEVGGSLIAIKGIANIMQSRSQVLATGLLFITVSYRATFPR